MPHSHTATPKPSSLLALIALAIVQRAKPAWIRRTIVQAAREEGVNPERISRLTGRALPLFDEVVVSLTRRGRPKSKEDNQQKMGARVAILEALLAVASALLAHLPKRRKVVRDLIVGAYLRLRNEHPSVTQALFCKTMALSPRTLRHWLNKTSNSKPGKPRPVKVPPKPRPPRRPRFQFNLLLPGTQIAADTTDIEAFGVKLKLIASQDVGGRNHDLLDAVIVDETENADLVCEVLKQTLAAIPGAQVITDQGTPYLAKKTKALLEELETEHAPQKEADPKGKSTLERAFRTAKEIAQPILDITNQLARNMPALVQPDLAKAAVTVVITVILRAYQAGARAMVTADEQRSSLHEERLQEMARRSREHARANERSARLLLEHIHDIYDIGGSKRDFVNDFRRYSVDVLKQAEQRFRRQAHRDNINNRRAYFAAIIRDVFDADKARRASRQLQDDEQHKREHQLDAVSAKHELWLEQPARWVRDALDAIAHQWLPDQRSLLADGAGAPRAWIRDAVQRLRDLYSPAEAIDISLGVLHDFRLANEHEIGPDAVDAVGAVLHRILQPLAEQQDHSCGDKAPPLKLQWTGRKPRPPPTHPLRN